MSNSNDITARITAYPSSKMRIGSKVYTVYINQAERTVYYWDEDAKDWKAGQFDPEQIQSLLDKSNSEQSASKAGDPEASTSHPKEKDNSGKRKFDVKKLKQNKSFLFLMIAFVALIVVITVVPKLASRGSSQSSSSTIDEKNTPAVGSSYSVLIAKKNILPGDQLNAENVGIITVSSSVFVSNPSIYRENEKDNVLGMYAISFIPYGAPVTWDNTGVSQNDLVSPYLQIASYMDVLVIPVNVKNYDLTTLAFGDYIDVDIEKYTRQQTNQETPITNTPAGMTHSSSVTSQIKTDYYTLNHFQVIDLLNPDKTSVYPLVFKYASIPYPYREDALPVILPDMKAAVSLNHIAYICLAVTSEQKVAIGDLQLDNSKVTIREITPNASIAEKFSRTSYMSACEQMIIYRDTILNGGN